MAKKKQKIPPKKPNRTILYVGLAVLIIASLAILFSSVAPEKKEEILPGAGGYVKLNMPTTYEPGKFKMTIFLKFDCTHCNDLDKNMRPFLEKYGDKIEVTYIPIVWPGQSTKSIEAYIIADQMGKGDAMREALFSAKFVKGMDVMESRLALEDVASSIGLGPEFKTRLEGNSAANAANANLMLMRKYNVEGTPTVIINGNLMANPPVLSNLENIVGSFPG